jgi:hypothetical protein
VIARAITHVTFRGESPCNRARDVPEPALIGLRGIVIRPHRSQVHPL